MANSRYNKNNLFLIFDLLIVLTANILFWFDINIATLTVPKLPYPIIFGLN